MTCKSRLGEISKIIEKETIVFKNKDGGHLSCMVKELKWYYQTAAIISKLPNTDYKITRSSRNKFWKMWKLLSKLEKITWKLTFSKIHFKICFKENRYRAYTCMG